MSVLIQLNNIRKNYGDRVLLDDATASFSHNQKIGIIGRNGAGKSTLCRILIGQEEMDSGSISKNSDLRLSYLEQHDPYEQAETVVDFLTRYTGKEEWECGEMAARFQLSHEMLYQPISSLAGGYQTRVKLTAMLLPGPNFLVLDEPSNYLDLSTLILLENFLKDFNGGYLIVSHDREFLKKTCVHTLEVEHGQLTFYPGDVEEYFEFKEEQLRQKIAYNRGIEKKREQLQSFIESFKAKAATASRAKSKMKQMQKLKTIEVVHTTSSVKIHIPSVENKGGVALQCENLEIGYPDKVVASSIDLAVDRGMHVAVLGDNGQGKTTFLRTIAEDLKSRQGQFKWASHLKIAYYAQHVFSSLHPEDTVFGHLQREAADGVVRQDVLDMAGCFLFQGDDVEKPIKVLSGGERARLCLAGMLLSKSHVLLLDEPTNHLDFETVEALATALRKFSGTVFFISHDRTFVNIVAKQILDIKDGEIRRYPGSYEDYVYHLECRARDENPDRDVVSPKGEDSSAQEVVAQEDGHVPGQEEESPPSESEDAVKRKNIKAEIRKIKTKIRKSETRIENLTKERDVVLADLEKNPFHFSKERNEKLKKITISIEAEEEENLKYMETLEKLQKSFKG